MNAAHETTSTVDVLVIGGAISGSSVAMLLRRWSPNARVLIVEASERFDAKVGEATVELTGTFLLDVLGLGDVLDKEHLSKHGLRFWFSNESGGRELAGMSEIGPWEVPTVPSFQLQRASLDESLIARARDHGAAVERPAKVKHVEHGWPTSRVTLETPNGEREVEARWVVDASGRRAFLARRAKRISINAEHPIAAYWGRWSGVRDIDDAELGGAATNAPDFLASRRLATNHFCGYGYWCWMIPLSGGATSIGLVFDRRHFDPPAADSTRERFEHFVRECPGLGELVANAELDAGDFHSYDQLSYTTDRYLDRGWSLVGDAASFLDPLYSPGLDHVAQTAYATARLIADDIAGLPEDELTHRIEAHNQSFRNLYERSFRALYLDKYEIFGDAELVAASYFLDTSMYYLGVVEQVYADTDQLAHPGFGKEVRRARLAYRFMRFYRGRLVRLARARRRLGIYGRRNRDWRVLHPSFRLGRAATRSLSRGVRLWLGAELGIVLRRLTPTFLRAPVRTDAGTPTLDGVSSTE